MTIRFLRSLRVTWTIIEFLPLRAADGKLLRKVLTPLGWLRRLQLGFCVYEFRLRYFAGVGLT
jgi:hypothetical protein